MAAKFSYCRCIKSLAWLAVYSSTNIKLLILNNSFESAAALTSLIKTLGIFCNSCVEKSAYDDKHIVTSIYISESEGHVSKLISEFSIPFQYSKCYYNTDTANK